MSSPMLENLYQNTGVDAAYLMIGMGVLILVLLILLIVMLCKLKRLGRKLDRFTRGKDAESLEETILACLDKTEDVDKMNQMLRDDMVSIRKNQRMTYQKMGMIKYDAFREMSGNLSFALALLDQQENGFVLNSVYAREGGYAYCKEIIKGECKTLLSEEESAALEKAKSQS